MIARRVRDALQDAIETAKRRGGGDGEWTQAVKESLNSLSPRMF